MTLHNREAIGAEDVVLSAATRWLVRASAALYLAVGLVFFLFPSQSAANFPWSVTPFMAMTIGGWCLGNAVIAWEAARVWRFAVVYPLLVYLWAFGPLELAVVGVFADRLVPGNVLTWPYLAALGVTAVSAVVGIVSWLGRRPPIDEVSVPPPRWAKPLTAFFSLFFLALAAAMLLARPGGLFATGGFFPEPMTPFTIFAFAAFFLSLSLAIGSFFVARSFRPYVAFARVSLLLDLPVMAAAVLHLDRFDWSRPLNILYFFGYLSSFIVIGWIVLRHRFDGGGAPRAAPAR